MTAPDPVKWQTCAACGRRVFSNGGHLHGREFDPLTVRIFHGFYDRSPLESQRFVNVWDEVTYLTDGDEGDR